MTRLYPCPRCRGRRTERNGNEWARCRLCDSRGETTSHVYALRTLNAIRGVLEGCPRHQDTEARRQIAELVRCTGLLVMDPP